MSGAIPYSGQNSAYEEVVRVVGRELQASKERIQELERALSESQSRSTRSSVSSKAESHLLERAVNAEAREARLQEELEESRNQLVKQCLKTEELQKQLLGFKATEQEEELVVAQERKMRRQLDLSRKEKANLDVALVQLKKQLTDMEAAKQERGQLVKVALLKQNEQVISLKADLACKAKENKALRARVSQLERNLNLLKKEWEQDKQTMAMHLMTSEDLGLPWPIEKYVTFAHNTHREVFTGRPEYGSLRPVCSADLKQLETHIQADARTRWVTGRYITLPVPGLLVWTSTSCQVGLAFSPMHEYTGPYGWSRDGGLAKHEGNEREVFFQSGDYTYYAGTYRFESTRERNPQGCERRDWENAKPLAELASVNCQYDRDPRMKPIQNAMTTLIEWLYVDGILKAECTILRCVGFDHEIHENLARRHERNGLMGRAGGPYVGLLEQRAV